MGLSQKLKQTLKQRIAPVQRLCNELLEVPLSDIDSRIESEQEENPYLEQDMEEEEQPVYFETTEQEGRRTDKGEFIDYWFQDDGDQAYRVSKQEDTPEREPISAEGGSLSEDLLQQLHLSHLDDREIEIGELIIGNIDQKGYLRRSVEAMADDYFFDTGREIEPEFINKVLKLVRSFEPAGVGATDLQDCLLLQLDRLSREDKTISLCRKIITSAWDLFCKKQYDAIEKKFHTSNDLLQDAIKQILKLNPSPGYDSNLLTDNTFIVPDFIVWQSEGEVKFRLNRPYKRHLKVSKEGQKLLEKIQHSPEKDEKTLTFLKDKIASAELFIEAFNQREQTLQKIMGAIIEYQKEYFLEGDTRLLRPMKYEDIKALTGYNESTISRMANEKYVQTHFGTFKLKEFFTNSLIDASGSEVSSAKVQNCLMELVQGEDKSSPYTDEQLTKLLTDKGFVISRRTVAKYRDKLNVPSASKRKSIGVSLKRNGILLNLIAVLFFSFSLSAQTTPSSDSDTRSKNRRIADSLYAVHTLSKQKSPSAVADTVSAKVKTENIQPKFISDSKDIPSSTLYQSTWYTERVKVPDFSIKNIPDEVVLRLINPSKGQHFCFPVKKKKSSSYGWRWGRPHTGIDIALNTGDKIYAAFDGVVRLAKYNGGYGNCVVIRHYNNLETLYGHLSKINVKPGQKVKAGDVIGLGGSTGHSTGPHLHFECRLLYACFDPEWIFDLETFSIKTSFIRIDKSYFGVESSQQKANKRVEKSRLSKVDRCFEGKPYVKTSSLIAQERQQIKEGKIPQYNVAAQNTHSASQNRYIVAKKGDKMSSIAKRYNLSEQTLKQLNPGIKNNTITKETKIRIK